MILQVEKYFDSDITDLFKGTDSIELEYEEGNPIGTGGFGQVFECLTINGQTPPNPIAIKVLIKEKKKTLSTIKNLQERIFQHQQKAKAGQETSLDTVSALKALPLLSFQARDSSGEFILGYVTNLLSQKEKYFSFNSFFEAEPGDEELLTKLQGFFYGGGIKKEGQLKLAASLVEGMHNLEKLDFIHSDINPSNLFICLDQQNPSCVIIDFDGGAVTRGHEFPTTIGKQGQWMSPQIAKQLINPNQESIKINANDDLWSVMLMIHQFFFPFHPLFFLQQQGYQDLGDYFSKNNWPKVDLKHPNIRSEVISTPQIVEDYKKEIKDLPREVLKQFQVSLNKGWQFPNKITSYETWSRAFEKALRITPKIRSFKSSGEKILEGESITLTWRASGYNKLFLHPGVGEIHQGVEEVILYPKGTTKYRLEAKSYSSRKTEEIIIQVFPTPKLTTIPETISILEGREVQFNLDGVHVKHVNIFWQDGTYLKKKYTQNVFTTPPIEESKHLFFLAEGEFGGSYDAGCYIKVLPRVEILSFSVDKSEILEDENITLSWEIAHAKKITIPGYGVGLKGNELTLKPTQSGNISLIAEGEIRGDRNQAEIEIIVHPIPVIDFFQSDKLKVLKGDLVELSWKVQNAFQVIIYANEEKEIASPVGRNSLIINETTEFRLEVISKTGKQISESFSVEVFPSAKIESFFANTDKISHGGTISLTWEIPNAKEIILYGNHFEAINISNLRTHSLTVENNEFSVAIHEFWLQVTDKTDLETISKSLTVSVYPVPVWKKVPPNRINLKQGDEYKLFTTAEFAAKAYILKGNEKEEIPHDGYILRPDISTQYSLQAEGYQGTPFIQRSFEIELFPQAVVKKFYSDLSFNFSGQYVSLFWEVTGHEELTLNPNQTILSGDSVEIQVFETTTFTLVAKNPCSTTSRSITIEVLKTPQIKQLILPEIPTGLMAQRVDWESKTVEIDLSKIQIRVPASLRLTSEAPVYELNKKIMERTRKIIDLITFAPMIRKINFYQIYLKQLYKKFELLWRTNNKRNNHPGSNTFSG